MAAYADSSALNGEGGHSWGGYGIGQPGSGLTHFRVLCPKQLADSSGGNELITAVLALKEVIAERIGQSELGTLPQRPTDLHLDAQVVLDGVAMDRVSRESRYLAAKLSMLREAVANGVIALTKIATAINPADIFTKPLVGAALERARGLVLGHLPVEPKASPAAVSVASKGVRVAGTKFKPGAGAGKAKKAQAAAKRHKAWQAVAAAAVAKKAEAALAAAKAERSAARKAGAKKAAFAAKGKKAVRLASAAWSAAMATPSPLGSGWC
jgi:hypothetical protein